MPCEQQTVSLGLRMAAIKALDGRMYWGIAAWLRAWCIRARCLLAEQPDVYIVDFYDAPYVETDPTEWGGEWRKKTLFFTRGARTLVPTHERGEGSQHWHRRCHGGGEAQARARDETVPSVAHALAAQLSPGTPEDDPDFLTEIERFAAAWWQAGLPLPPDYDNPLGQPSTVAERAYARMRGVGDGRRLEDTTVPALARTCGAREAPAPRHPSPHRVWTKREGEARGAQARPRIPAVTQRGRALAQAAHALLARERAHAARAHPPTVALDDVRSDALVVIPARRVGPGLAFLVPAHGEHLLLGKCSEFARGATSASRKAGTLEACQLLKSVLGEQTDELDVQLHSAPVIYTEVGAHRVALVAAWMPRACADAAREAGLVWRRAVHLQCEVRRRLCALVAWRADGWSAPVRDIVAKGTRGGVEAAATREGSYAQAPPLDTAQAEEQLAEALDELSGLLQAEAAANSHISAELLKWRAKLAEWDTMLPPKEVAACALQPDAARFVKLSFSRRCSIPTTPPMEQRWPPPVWPPYVPKPVDALATYLPEHRGAIAHQLERLRAWNEACVRGETRARPEAKCWSDQARLPWLRGRLLDMRGSECCLLGAGGPALQTQLSREAWLWMFADYPHKRLASYIYHGVRMGDTLELDTILAPNLYSLYEVDGGAAAVAEEMDKLKERGWYSSSAGPSSRAEPAPARLLTSPGRYGPRGAVPRKDAGPPRGVAEDGFPRQLELTIDLNSPVDSLNNSSGRRVGQGGPIRDIFPLDEVKPRAQDACWDTVVLWSIAQQFGQSLILLLFDYKYFFHQLTYEMAEIWKRGFAVPAHTQKVGPHPTVLDVLLELVMAMGWTRASLIAQDLANALVWRLFADTDAALQPYVARLTEASASLRAMWQARVALPHDDYGTQARLVTALQYTDDMIAVAAGPHAAATLITCFARMIGPTIYPSAEAAEAARGTARRHAVLMRGDGICQQVRPRGHGCLTIVGTYDRAPPSAATAPAFDSPFVSQDRKSAAQAMACLLATANASARDVEQIAALCGVGTDAGRADKAARELPVYLGELTRMLDEGARVALRCACAHHFQLGGDAADRLRCSAEAVRAHVHQQRVLAEVTRLGPPADPVTLPPAEAFGLNLEAAKASKWHLGGAGVWIGVGLSATLLVTWVPQHKAIALLGTTDDVLRGECTVARYRSYVGALQDIVLATGGGSYRLKGLSAPLMAGAEVDEGPTTLVRLRTQMKARLTAWQAVLANKPGASMLAHVPAPQRADFEGGLTWEISGDAASECGSTEGLGAFFYGFWWNVPLVSIPGMQALHITCLELIELGLGVVTVGPWLTRAKHVRLVSDALVAVCVVRARTAAGKRARDAQAAALVAVHEVILAQPEWRALQASCNTVEVAQQYGETLLLDDAASRGRLEVIRTVCKALCITPTRIDPLPRRSMDYLFRAVAAATAAAAPNSHVAAKTGPHPFGVEAIEHVAASLRRAIQEFCGLNCEPTSEGCSLAPPYVRTALPSLAGDDTDPRVDAAIRREEVSVLVPRRSRAVGELCGDEAADAQARAVACGEAYARALRAHPLRPAAWGAPVARTSAVAATPLALHQAGARARASVAMAAAPQAALLARKAPKDDLEDVRRLLVERSVLNLKSNEDGLGITGQVDDLLRGLLLAAQQACERRFAASTRRLDSSYWKFWKEWCTLLGTPPLRTNVAANSGVIPHLHEREVALALGAFMAFVADNPSYKVDSMLARLRGVARKHRAVGIAFVSLATVVSAAAGLIQEHIDVHGADSLLPKSKEPFTHGEIAAMLSLPAGTIVGGVLVGDNLHWQGVRVLLSLFCTMGCRKEAVALGPSEVLGPRKLTLWNVTWRLLGSLHRAPSLAQLRSISAGDMVYVTPCPCKNDPTGMKYGNSPVPSAWHPTRRICLARELARYEAMRLVPEGQRRGAPLVLNPNGGCWTKASLDVFFKALVRTVATEERARQLSVHSFRVWLACSLLAVRATPEQIMLLLRWSSDEARRLYARMGDQQQVNLLDAAAECPLDTVRAHTLYAAASAYAGAPPEVASPAQQAAAAVEQAQALLQAAQDVTGPLPRACDLPAPIDDDDAIRRVHVDIDSLHAAARRADQTLALQPVDSGTESD